MNPVVELTNHHRPKKGDANLFGVVLYTERHAHVRKMLLDGSYWSALDEISGPLWAVFATRAAPGRHEFPSLPPGTIGLLIPIWKEPRENRQLLETFEIRSTENLPCLVVFAFRRDGSLCKKLLRIDDTSEAAAYESVKKWFAVVANGLEKISDRRRQDDGRTFETIVNYHLAHEEEWQILKKGVEILKWLRSLIQG